MSKNEDYHDILIIPKNGNLYRIEHDTDGGFDGSEGKRFTPNEPGQRRTINIASPGRNAPRQWGPALATVPKKREPATSQVCCYVVNTENVRTSNPWTKSKWSSEPDDENRDLTADAAQLASTLKFMVAGSEGKVYHLELDQTQDRVVNTVKLDLKLETEIYIGLRNGLVAGAAPYAGAGNTILPLINLSALPGNEA